MVSYSEPNRARTTSLFIGGIDCEIAQLDFTERQTRIAGKYAVQSLKRKGLIAAQASAAIGPSPWHLNWKR